MSQSLDASLIQGVGISLRVLKVLLICPGEAVRSAEVFLCAHVEIVVLVGFKYCEQAGERRNPYGSWRQSGVDIGVIGAFHGEHVVVDSLQREVVQREFHRRVSLQWHADAQAVEIHGRDGRLLLVVCRLFVYDAGEGGHHRRCWG